MHKIPVVIDNYVGVGKTVRHGVRNKSTNIYYLHSKQILITSDLFSRENSKGRA